MQSGKERAAIGMIATFCPYTPTFYPFITNSNKDEQIAVNFKDWHT